MSVSTFTSVNRISRATVVLQNGNTNGNYDEEEGNFPLALLESYSPGSLYAIKASYGDQQEGTTIFEGIIIKQSMKVSADHVPVLELEMRDPLVRSTIQRKNRVFAQPKDASGDEEKISDADVIDQILNEYNLERTLDIAENTLNNSQIVQYYCTDWDFILSRAEMNGLLVILHRDKITIKKPTHGVGDGDLAVILGRDIVSMNACIDARHQYPQAVARSWDASTQSVSASTPATGPGIDWQQGNFTRESLSDVIGLNEISLQHSGNRDNSELDAWAKSSIFRSELAKVQGNIRVLGASNVNVGDFVRIEGMGKRLDGVAFVSGVVHTYNGDDIWYTDLEIGLDHKWFAYKYEDIIDQPASGLIPAVNGLQIGKVLEVNGDPFNENRLLIDLPVLTDEGTATSGVWARLASFSAGAGAEASMGSFFYPEIGDEVIVGFINDDPRDAIVLGSLYSAGENHGLPREMYDDDGNVILRGFVSKSNMELTFDEKEQKITLKTPGNKELILQDTEGGGDSDGDITLQDANGNKIVMNKDGITIESAGDITMKSSKAITIEGGTEVKTSSVKNTVEGTGNLDVSGGIVSISGSQISLG